MLILMDDADGCMWFWFGAFVHSFIRGPHVPSSHRSRRGFLSIIMCVCVCVCRLHGADDVDECGVFAAGNG